MEILIQFQSKKQSMWSLNSVFVIATLLNIAYSNKDTDGSMKSGIKSFETPSCQPNITYVNSLETCECTKTGRWPNNDCSQLFETIFNDTVFKNKCKKNSYVKVHCNICQCDDKGELNFNRCTRHVCDSDHVLNNSRKSIESIPGECSPKTWYSFTPCQLCYCVNENKLVCNPANKHLDKLTLGKYSFSVCGDMFLKDTIDLIPSTDKSLRLDKKKIDPNSALEVKYAPAPVPPDYNDDREEVVTVRQRMYTERSSESNSVESDDEDEDDDIKMSNKYSGTRMPELERIVSGEHVNIHKQRSEEESESDTPVTEKAKKIPQKEKSSSKKIENKVRVHTNIGLRNQDKNTEETFYREFNLSDIFKKFLGLQKVSSRRAVSLESKSACKPGTEIAKDCNMCYCMRNGNLLCTKKLC